MSIYKNFIFIIATLVIISSYAFAANIQYTYDNLNRLIKTDYGDGKVIEYSYDDVGNRVVHTVTVPNVPAGSLTVIIFPQGAIDAGAQWRMTGENTWRGNASTATNIPVGQVTVEFRDLSGWTKPANQNVGIIASQTATAIGTYTQATQITADFTASPMSGKAPLKVTFTDKSTGTIKGWLWEFGDGRTSTKPNPVYSYKKAGSYTVKLTVTGPEGSSTATQAALINAYAVPKANFTATPKKGVAPLQVGFTDKSTGTITTWAWNFGDTQTSNEQNPVHTYDGVGTFTVSLTTEGPAGTSTKTQRISIKAPK